MESAKLETRPLYGIGTVARLTGLKPDTLRVWERRYGLGASLKSDTGRRRYTQADLEHLQLIAALISSGSRIGEIASSDRRTLEMLCRRQAGQDALPMPKARVLFLGPSLCSWVDDHQGCLANVEAVLCRDSLAEAQLDSLENVPPLDVLVAECSASSPPLERIGALVSLLNPARVVISGLSLSPRWARELEARQITAMAFPPDTARLVFELTRTLAEKTSARGNTDLGELVDVKPREFSDVELAAARGLQSSLDCECPKHMTELIEALAEFEQYSSGCAVDDWEEAAVHACIYAYTGQARWLMERALRAVLDHKDDRYAGEAASAHSDLPDSLATR